MNSINSAWLIVALVIFMTTTIILTYGLMIYRAIKNYNQKSLNLQKDLEEVKFRQERLILESEIEIQEQTFKYISMEIHDNITQCLSLAKLHLNCLSNQDTADRNERVTKSKDLVSKALDDLSNLSKSLDSDLIESHGLITAIEYEVERWKRLGKNQIELDIQGQYQYLNTQKELIAYRIIQEALGNTIKHSNATRVEIKILIDLETISISITDNGLGFNIKEVNQKREAGKMSGLRNMRARAESIKSDLVIDSCPGKGSTITLVIKKNIEHDKDCTSRRSQVIA